MRTALAVVTKPLTIAATVLSWAILLSLGAVVAQADPSFVLTQSGAGPGDSVSFSIAGTEKQATYSLDVDGEDAAAGSVPAGAGVSGQFTMPNLGDTSRAVTVEAKIKESGETTTRARILQYLAPSQASTGPAEPQPTPAVAAAPSTQPVHATRPTPHSSQHKQSSRPARAKRHARPAPQPAPERHASEPRGSARAGYVRRPGSPVAASPVSTSAPFTAGSEGRRPLSTARSESRPPHKSDGSIKTTFLTGPATPAIFALASEVAGNGNGGPPALAAMVLLLLGLTALTLAGPGLVPRPRSARVKRRAPSSKRPRADRVVSANGAPGRAVTTPEHPEALDVLLRESVALFEPIPLAVLDQHATLATRSERKFILDARTFGRLVGELSPHYLILEIDDARVFPYDTIYFDTPELTTYRQHLQGRRRRFKCRSRLYAASDLCFFEIKLKGRRGETIKRRLPLEVEEHGSLTGPALAFLESELDQAYGVCPPAVLGPVLRTSYRRLTLAGRRDSERVTFDFELMFAADGMECSIQPGRILVETKVDNGEAGWEVKRVLRRLGVRPVQTCSKYCLGVTLTHPEVPNNPFRPLIRQHFDGSRHARTRIYEPRQVEPAVELEGEWQPVAPMLRSWQEGTA